MRTQLDLTEISSKAGYRSSNLQREPVSLTEQ